jgi:hypothetical protein
MVKCEQKKSTIIIFRDRGVALVCASQPWAVTLTALLSQAIGRVCQLDMIVRSNRWS